MPRRGFECISWIASTLCSVFVVGLLRSERAHVIHDVPTLLFRKCFLKSGHRRVARAHLPEDRSVRLLPHFGIGQVARLSFQGGSGRAITPSGRPVAREAAHREEFLS